MKIGYARVSTEDQNLDLQLHALHREGCARIFEEKITGTTLRRPALTAAMKQLHSGDVLVVWKLDRLGRSVQHLIEITQELERRAIGFQSLAPAIDTTSPTGKFFFHVMAALAEFEASLISERTKAGLDAARRRGTRLGRPHRLNAQQIERARFLCEYEHLSMAMLAGRFNVGESTVRRALKGQRH